jgi:hypothetical protein
VKRPAHYFDPNNPDWPEVIELRLQMPVALELDYGPELARERIAERVQQRRHQAWNKAKRMGMGFVGPRRVLRLAHTKRAKSYEVFGTQRREPIGASPSSEVRAIRKLRPLRSP